MNTELKKRFVNKEKEDYFFSENRLHLPVYRVYNTEVLCISVTDQRYAKQFNFIDETCLFFFTDLYPDRSFKFFSCIKGNNSFPFSTE